MTPMTIKATPITARMLATALTLSLVLVCTQGATASPQATDAAKGDEATPAKPIEILDEPSALDPATLMEPRLAATTTVAFDKVTMKELYRWLQEDQKLSVSVDAAAMKEEGILSSELVTDQLDNEPLYLILDRLKSLGIGWYEEGGDLFLTTTDAASQKMMTVSYNLGELLDAGFEGERIVEAIAEIARVSAADIRANAAELKKAGVRDRSPISLEMSDQKLSLVLQAALSDFKLTWLVQDGVIWIVQNSTAEAATRTATYDVRDLCRDAAESEALMYALMEQAGGSWEDNGDKQGVLLFVRPGILVVRHTEQMLDSVLQLLENYRTALRESKPRKKLGPDPKEVVTYYYRLPTEIRDDTTTIHR